MGSITVDLECPYCGELYMVQGQAPNDEAVITVGLTIECPCGATFAPVEKRKYVKKDPEL